jgi:hypothetical protein
MEKNKLFTKVFIIGAGMTFLASSVAGLSGLIATSLNKPTTGEKITQSQNAQLQTQERGFLGVLQREPDNPTALRGISAVWVARIQAGDAQGVKTTIDGLVKSNPQNKRYKEFQAEIDKIIASSKNVGTLNSPTPAQSAKPSK